MKAKIGFRGLKKIQEETLFAVDTKYRFMKNTMKITGVAGTVMLGFAAIFKILHFPGAGILLTLGALMLSFIFLPSALVVLWKETKSGKRLVLFISAFLAGTSFIFGILFKIQHWPGAALLISLFVIFGAIFFLPILLINKLKDQENKPKKPVYIIGTVALIIYISGFCFRIMHWPLAGTLMVAGSVILFFIIFPWYTWLQWKDDPHVNARFIFMVVASLLFIIPGALVNLSLEQSYDEGFFIQQEQQEALISYQEKNNNDYLIRYQDSVAYPLMEKLHSGTGELIDIIHRIEWRMVEIAEGPAGPPFQDMPEVLQLNKGKAIPYRSLTRPFHSNPILSLLLPGCTARPELEKSLSSYRRIISQQLGNDWIKPYEELINSSTYLPGANTPRTDMALMTGLHSLSMLKNGVLITESAALSQIALQK